MENEYLLNYIKRQRAEGFADENIRDALSNAGYSRELIDALLSGNLKRNLKSNILIGPLILINVMFLLVASAAAFFIFTLEKNKYSQEIKIQQLQQEISLLQKQQKIKTQNAVSDNNVSQEEEIKVDIKQPPEKVLLSGYKWVPQTFNNCGPATASMILEAFGYSASQTAIKNALRTNVDDRNVFIYEIAKYINDDFDLETKLLYNGSVERLKLLLANGFYVITENWLHPNEDIGHFTIIRGYDDTKGVFIVDDSFVGLNLEWKYDTFDKSQWKAFNRTHMLVYKKDSEDLIKAIIGKDWDKTTMHQNAILKNEESIAKDPKDLYAWFNIGMSYYSLGEYEKSVQAFDEAKKIGWPHRMLWYQIYPIQAANKAGQYEKALTLADEGLRDNESFAELHYEKALAYEGLGNTAQEKQELTLTIKYYPDFKDAQAMLDALVE